MPCDPARRAEEDESLQFKDQHGITFFLEIVGVYLRTLDIAPMVSGRQGVLDDVDPAVSNDEQSDGRHQAGGNSGEKSDRGHDHDDSPHQHVILACHPPAESHSHSTMKSAPTNKSKPPMTNSGTNSRTAPPTTSTPRMPNAATTAGPRRRPTSL